MASASQRITALGQYIGVAFKRYESLGTMNLVQSSCS